MEPITSAQLVIPFLIAFSISLGLTPLVRFLAGKYGFIDDPKRNHPAILHNKPIPRAGGVAMYIAFAICAFIFTKNDTLLYGILIGGGINVIVGTLDDKFDISPYIRLGVQVISVIAAILTGVHIYMANPFGSGLLYFDILKINLANITLIIPGDLLLIIWTVFMMNTINWTKGASQLPGVSVIAFLTLAAVALKFQAGNPYQTQTALLSVISAGAVLAFLPFNFPPEKMFPGFGASTFIGFNIAILSVLSGGKFAAVIVVLAIPIIDALLVGTKRMINRKNPLTHDRSHFYHLLLKTGFSKRQIIIIYYVATIVLAYLAIYPSTNTKIIIPIAMGTLLLLFYRRLSKTR